MTVLLQEDTEVATVLRANGTPSAYLFDAQGMTQGRITNRRSRDSGSAWPSAGEYSFGSTESEWTQTPRATDAAELSWLARWKPRAGARIAAPDRRNLDGSQRTRADTVGAFLES